MEKDSRDLANTCASVITARDPLSKQTGAVTCLDKNLGALQKVIYSNETATEKRELNPDSPILDLYTKDLSKDFSNYYKKEYDVKVDWRKTIRGTWRSKAPVNSKLYEYMELQIQDSGSKLRGTISFYPQKVKMPVEMSYLGKKAIVTYKLSKDYITQVYKSPEQVADQLVKNGIKASFVMNSGTSGSKSLTGYIRYPSWNWYRSSYNLAKWSHGDHLAETEEVQYELIAKAKEVTKKLSASQVKIFNNKNKSDTITVSKIERGSVVKV
ncbi:hypothetical protein [Peribacillus glennii]|uniref:Uncharacterized protein n=1 Tax=Peribacillus glennii TaxID=2303991 RepID=A0A372L7C9_9BACI|nr:hypothetical protein [Peribacillus glennii]RFU61120.1 hypothetical protein D0466_19245 [Peribacillus glennii]